MTAPTTDDGDRGTDRRPTRDEDGRDRRTVRDVDHTHPDEGPALRDLYRRGKVATTDGGGPSADRERDTVADVDHWPPHENGGAARVFERGPATTPPDPPE